jgi:hypothetical protein
MPGRYNVYVFKDGAKYYVKPAVAMVSHTLDADGVKIRNLTDYTLEVALFSGPHIHIPAGQVRSVLIPDDADGVYDYSVDVLVGPGPHGSGPHSGPEGGLADKVAAIGNSFPKIIVDP